MKNVVKAAAVTVGAAALCLSLAQPASAASFGPINVGDGTVSYNDTYDRLCASAYNSEGARQVKMTLTRLNQAGPSGFSVVDKNNYYGHSGSTCSTALSSAYEDTYYKAVVTTYWGERGTWQHKVTKYFYS